MSDGECIVGFGEQSKRASTHNSNWFARFTTTPCLEGARVTVECLHGMRFADGETKKELVMVRARREPRVGQRVRIDGRMIKVARKRRDHAGRLELLDEDTRQWVIWRER